MITTAASSFAFGLFVLAYLIGSIPFGLVLTRFAGMGDIRNIGSGNIGATNVLRTGNKALALGTLLLDGGKGAAIALIAWAITGEISVGYVCGFAAFIGHLFPIYLNFQGGKGVATGLGIFLAINPLAGLCACATWLVVAAVFRFSSAAALAAFTLAPVYLILFGAERSFIMLSLVMIYIVWGRHRENLNRLMAGTESKISLGGQAA